MPQPIGSDRVQVRRDGNVLLICPRPKEWVARRNRTSTSAEHPGTAVFWEDTCWEVLSLEQSAGGATRYLLAPWSDSHTIRVRADYDEASEARRAAEWRRTEERRKRRWLVLLFSFIAGLAPARVLEKIEHEYGVRRETLVWASMAPQFAFSVYCFAHLPIVGLPNPPGPVLSHFMPLGFYFIAECALRVRLLLGGKAIGSLLGVIPWLIWSVFRKESPDSRAEQEFFEPGVRDLRYRLILKSDSDLRTASMTPASAQEALEDAVRMREPFLTLLTPPEQELLRSRVAYQPLNLAKQMAAIIFVLASSGAIASWLAIWVGRHRFSLWLSALSATYLAAEQVYRLRVLDRGKTVASVLAFAGRPMMRTILARAEEAARLRAQQKARLEAMAEPEAEIE